MQSRKRKLAQLYEVTVCSSGRPQDRASDQYFQQLQAFQDANDLQKYVSPYHFLPHNTLSSLVLSSFPSLCSSSTRLILSLTFAVAQRSIVRRVITATATRDNPTHILRCSSASHTACRRYSTGLSEIVVASKISACAVQ